MRFCIGFTFQNEADWLALHLPVWLATHHVSALVAVDGGSDDSSAAVIKDAVGAANQDRDAPVKLHLYEHPFQWDFAAQQNRIISHAEALGYEAMLKIDPDELMFPEHIDQAAFFLREFKCLTFPRFNFEETRRLYCPQLFPDYQRRAWRLGQGVHWAHQHHATIDPSLELIGWQELATTSDVEHATIRLPHLPMFHYEGTKTREHRAWKIANYQRTAMGQDPIPWGATDGDGPLPPPYRFRVPFMGTQPLEPSDVGVRAPVSY